MDDLKQKLTAALDGHTRYSRDCSLSGDYLAGLVLPIVNEALERAATMAICRVGAVAESVASLSATGGMETAGMIVSALYERPELVGPFMREGCEFMLTGDILPEKGRLTFHRRSDGAVTTPQELRAAIMVNNMARGKAADQAR
jgi:hypothetical protein